MLTSVMLLKIVAKLAAMLLVYDGDLPLVTSSEKNKLPHQPILSMQSVGKIIISELIQQMY